ncbi:MAG TPA: SDR family NAD(P)-dependent oxidoreductase, partial [Methylomirabilota bacterium]|nr:SDR family NAD(P)-dependent oxidoreductase [Methylomirabilota bacterium]
MADELPHRRVVGLVGIHPAGAALGLLGGLLHVSDDPSGEGLERLLAVGRPGAIVNIASTNAYIPATGLAAYCASKGGVLMFTRVAAMELGAHRIRVNAIAPGSTLTGLTTMAFSRPRMEDGFLRHTP